MFGNSYQKFKTRNIDTNGNKLEDLLNFRIQMCDEQTELNKRFVLISDKMETQGKHQHGTGIKGNQGGDQGHHPDGHLVFDTRSQQ